MDVLNKLNELFLSVWKQGILGVDFFQIIVGLGIFVLFLILILPCQVNAKPVRPDLVGKTQSNISIPLFTAPKISDGVPTPIK